MANRVMSQISIDNYIGTVKPKLQLNEQLVLNALEDIGRAATAEEVAEYMKWPLQSFSGRFTGLKNKKRIVFAFRDTNSRGRSVAYYLPASWANEREYGENG